MKKLLALLATTVLAIAVAAPALAQAPGPGGRPGGAGGQGRMMNPERMKQLEEMRTKILGQLGLSAQQKTKIQALDNKLKEDLEKLVKAPGELREKAPKMRELRQKHQQDTMAVLTEPQKTKFQELMREEMRKMMDGEKGKGGGKGKGKGGG